MLIGVSDIDNSKEGNLLDDYENSGDEYNFEDTDIWQKTSDEGDMEEDVDDIWGSDEYKWCHSKPLSIYQIVLIYNHQIVVL